MEPVHQRRVRAILGHVLPFPQYAPSQLGPTAASTERMLEGKVPRTSPEGFTRRTVRQFVVCTRMAPWFTADLLNLRCR